MFFFPVPEPVIEEPGCVTDGDCPSKHACFSGECLNPCVHLRPCVRNANCVVKDELPWRVMVCTCNPGYSGKGDERCDLIGMTIVSINFDSGVFNLSFSQNHPVRSGALLTESAHPLGLATTADVSTHVSLTIRAVPKPFAHLRTISLSAHAQPA